MEQGCPLSVRRRLCNGCPVPERYQTHYTTKGRVHRAHERPSHIALVGSGHS